MEQYQRQQKLAFGLLFFAVGLGVAMTGLLLGRLVFGSELKLGLMSEAATALTGVAFGSLSFKLYKHSGKQLDKIISQVF